MIHTTARGVNELFHNFPQAFCGNLIGCAANTLYIRRSCDEIIQIDELLFIPFVSPMPFPASGNF
jgi:hypothetical protein